jgi:hypothetical protein
VGARAVSFLQAFSEQSPSQAVLACLSSLLLLLLATFSVDTHYQLVIASDASVVFCCHPHAVPVQANVRVVPAKELYPTVASMVEEMELRRDLTESLVKIWTRRMFSSTVVLCWPARGSGDAAHS